MSANINTMAYAGEKPWHGLGTKVSGIMTSVEAIVAAGLDWKVTKEEIFYKSKDLGGALLQVHGKYATVRNDNGNSLGVVGEVYRPLQNRDAFSFFDAVVGEKAAMYEVAGALGRGERIWLLAKLPDTISVTKNDTIEKFLLLSNSHDGSSAVTMMFTPIRVVCQNTLNCALHGGGKVRVRHTLNIGDKVRSVRDALGIVTSYYKMLEEATKFLVSKPTTTEIVEKMLADIGLGADQAKDSTKIANNRDQVLSLYRSGKGNSEVGVKGTLWALFNGVTEYVDHYATVRRTDGSSYDDARARSVLFGSGAVIKQTALDSLLAIR